MVSFSGVLKMKTPSFWGQVNEELKNVIKVCCIVVAFFEEDDSESQSAIEADYLSAEWLQELPEDLDMCIAQRDFEGAVDLVERGLYIIALNRYRNHSCIVQKDFDGTFLTQISNGFANIDYNCCEASIFYILAY